MSTSEARFSMDTLREMAKFGGWITVTNFIAPIVNIVDRFFISIMISTSMVAYYATPFEVINRLSLIPSALATVLFPMLGKQLIDDPVTAKNLYLKSKIILWFIVFTGSLFIVVFGYPFMKIWINEVFADKSKYVIIFITAGVFINGLAYLPYTYMQSCGLPKQVALLHLLEVLIFIPTLMIMIKFAGITGASIAWFFRALVDYLFLEFMTNKKMGQDVRITSQTRTALSLVLILLIPLIGSLYIRCAILVVMFMILYTFYSRNIRPWLFPTTAVDG